MEKPTKQPPCAARSNYVLALVLVGVAVAVGFAASSGGSPEPALPPQRPPRPMRPVATPPAPKPAEDPKAAPPVQRDERDGEGRLLRRVTAAGRVWSYERDALGRVVATDGPEGRVARTLDVLAKLELAREGGVEAGSGARVAAGWA